MAATEVQAVAPGTPAAPSTAPAAGGLSWKAILIAAGAGVLVGGPPGALIGGIIGAVGSKFAGGSTPQKKPLTADAQAAIIAAAKAAADAAKAQAAAQIAALKAQAEAEARDRGTPAPLPPKLAAAIDKANTDAKKTTGMEIAATTAVIKTVLDDIPLVSEALKIIGIPGTLAGLFSGQPVMDPATGLATLFVGSNQLIVMMATQTGAAGKGMLFGGPLGGLIGGAIDGSVFDKLTPAQKTLYNTAVVQAAAGQAPDIKGLIAAGVLAGGSGTKMIRGEYVGGLSGNKLTKKTFDQNVLDAQDDAAALTRAQINREFNI